MRHIHWHNPWSRHRCIRCAAIAIIVLSALAIPPSPLQPTPVQAALPGTATSISGNVWFDSTCAPSYATMQAWWNFGPYWHIGIYIGGSNRRANSLCNNNENLTVQWVSQVYDLGWNFVPIWVGPQAPCKDPNQFYVMSWDPGTAYVADHVILPGKRPW